MRAGWWLWASLAFAPWAMADDLAEMNAVSRAWDRYAETSSENKAGSVDWLSTSSLVHFGFLRDAALYASTEQLRRLPSVDRLTVYLLRATQSEDALKKLDNRAVAVLCMERGWAGVRKNENAPLVALSHVTVVGDYAVGELAPPTEAFFQFGPDFDREGNSWKYRYLSLVPDSSASIDEALKRSSLGNSQFFEMVIGNLLETADPPRLAVLDRALLDDSVARVRLNEQWPEYDTIFGRRVGAVKQKAQDGDAFAQMSLGSMKLSGDSPKWIPRDEPGGVELLEKSSDGGNTVAAEVLVQYLGSDFEQLDEARLTRIARHAQRAADAGRPMAMSALAQLHFEGSGGLPRNCLQAAEWYARAEEAGALNARNDLVWALATCPIPEQRNPVRALELARHMIEQRETLGSSELDTVAAALAANGQFEKAIEFQQRAIDGLNKDAGSSKARTATLKRMQARLAGYRKGRAYVQDYNVFAEARAGRY